VTREDIRKFISDCFDQGLVPRTVYDRLVTVLQLFKRHGLKGLVERSDWRSYVETIRPIYEAEEIASMLRHADQDEATLIKFFLFSGFRDREIRYMTWRDVDFWKSVVRVTAKPIWRFKSKNCEESCRRSPSCKRVFV
jgi:integrase